MELPSHVKEKITRAWGEQGAEWAALFPEALRQACNNWGLTKVQPFGNLSYHFVASARRRDRTVVLKLGVPEPEFEQEAMALQAIQGPGCVELIDYHPHLAALLLGHVVPGVPLESSWTEADDDRQTKILAQAMIGLWREPHVGTFPTTLKWSKALGESNGAMPDDLIRKARFLWDELENDAQKQMLLHGDLHHGNILRGGDGYKVIDPKGVVGDPCFEVYALLHNPVGAPKEFLLENWRNRIEIVAQVTGLDEMRLIAWGFCGIVMSCCWSSEAGEQPPESDLILARKLEAAIC